MDAITNYIKSFYKVPDILENLEIQHKTRKDIIPSIGLDVGMFLSWLIKFSNCKRVLELGSCIGYSTIILGYAVKQNGGRLISIEKAKNHYIEACKNIKDVGLEDTIEIINADAEVIIVSIEGTFDFILQDAAKSLYPKLLEKCIDKLSPKGIIVADDTLFKPLNFNEKYASYMDQYNKLVFSNSRLESIILPIGDGITLSYKK